jgi:hypothetical protein
VNPQSTAILAARGGLISYDEISPLRFDCHYGRIGFVRALSIEMTESRSLADQPEMADMRDLL